MSKQRMTAAPERKASDKITFCEHCRPPLLGGRHTINVAQKIKFTDKSSFLPTAHKAGQEAEYTAQKTFFVNADRFVLPEGTVKSVYPPRGADGRFSLALPHVVLSDKMLPWTWNLKPDQTMRAVDYTPWLALLVFTLDDPDIPEPVLRRLRDLKNPESNVLCYPGLRLEEAVEDLAAPILTIDVPKELYLEIAPTEAELKILAHTRIVGVESRRMKSSDPENGPEEYSVVVGNRLPRTEKTVVHLVSLVGMEGYLHGGTKDWAGKNFVRLVSLDSWQFLTLEPTDDFKRLMSQTLNAGDPSTLRLPSLEDQNGDDFIDNALAMGYVAMNHQTRAGDKTVSWYRGPLLPYGTESGAATFPVLNSDSLTRYDNQTGLFDVSYAAAWQLGRLLALQDKDFAVALYNWKLSTEIETIREVEQEIIESSLGQGLARRLQSRKTPGKRTAARLTDSLLELLADEAPKALALSPANGNGAGQMAAPTRLPKIGFETLLNRVTSVARTRSGSPEQQELPDLVKEWLGKLRLLHRVPFSYIVPDEKMLPPESLRFVYLDRNWINSLTDGALSIGRSTQSMLSQDRANLSYFQQEALAACIQERPRRLKIPAISSLSTTSDTSEISGFLLHSRVVQDYPGLEAQGFDTADTENANQLQIFHFQRIAENVLLCLFVGKAEMVLIMVPTEGVNFGVDEDESGKLEKKPLRKLAPPSDLGQPATGKAVDIPLRNERTRVVNVQELASRLQRELDATTFTSAEFALQMVDEGAKVIFWTKAEEEIPKDEDKS